MVMERKGQVFLMAAIILAGILLSLTRISNQGLTKKEPEAFYDLADEIDFEVRKVLDYGVISGGTNTGDYTTQLLNNYSEYIASEDVVFIYGNTTNVSAVYYQSLTNLNAVSLGDISFPVTITLASQTPVQVQPLDNFNSVATVGIRENNYTFNLKPGQNFYFVLIKGEEGEQFVTIE